MNARRLLAFAALVLGALALVTGSPEARGPGGVDIAGLAHSVETEADHVDALELATWIKERKDGLRVIDVRTQGAFDEYHIPSAEWIPLTKLASTRFAPNETVVLYSDGGAHAAQGWVFMQLAGHRRTYFIRGGLLDWFDDVMNPRLAVGASDSATRAYERASVLSRYFGGQPVRETGPASTVPMPAVEATDANIVQSLIRKRKKRGC